MKREFPRISRTERIILDLLVHDEELYGLQIVERSNGLVKRGTVYVTLGRMQEKGYVSPVPSLRCQARSGFRVVSIARLLYGAAVLKAWTRMATALARLRPARGLS